MPKLEVKSLNKRFGGVHAVRDISISVAAGSIVGLIGPNGSGKSTLMNLITNVETRDSGTVRLDDKKIDHLPMHKLAALGVARTFQEVRIFRDLSVMRNLAVVALGRGIADWQRKSAEWLELMGLTHLADETAGSLSIGQQRLLELCMSMLSEPSILFLDEPLAGVNPVVRQKIADVVRRHRENGATCVIVEHDMQFVMNLCDRLIVMERGGMIADGPPTEVRKNPVVINALIGRRER